jgi:hypothetical protein
MSMGKKMVRNTLDPPPALCRRSPDLRTAVSVVPSASAMSDASACQNRTFSDSGTVGGML